MVISIFVFKTESFTEPNDHKQLLAGQWALMILFLLPCQFPSPVLNLHISSPVFWFVDTVYPKLGPHFWEQLLIEPGSLAQKWFIVISLTQLIRARIL